ncbi:MAG: NAD(P)/FAD-dependent oxidoreductase [Campylobacterota bacterium]|nr:NAD(P)/FAD-dependent oxidoreductase [Campylobacterota bacterium]
MIKSIKQTSQLTNKTKIAIVGAGASGLLTSIFLSKNNFDVNIYEKNNKVGKKLLATGNGRCNITNSSITINNFYSNSDIKLLKKTLHTFDFQKCKQFFNDIGIEFTQGEKGRIYPMSQTSSSIVNSLEFAAVDAGVKIDLNSEIKTIEFKDDKFTLNNSAKYDKLIIATGSVAMPKLGSDDSGYNFAKQFKHNIIKPFPSLVQLISDNKNLDMISGVKIQGGINNKTGDILFTKYGVSGSTILDISREISDKLQHNKSVKISIDIIPTISKNKLIDILLSRVQILGNKDIYSWLDGIINKKLSRYILENSNISSSIKYAKFLNRKDILKIVHTMKNLEFNITGTKGFESCEVCAGGIDLSQIDLTTMESKKQKNLFFTGEVIDVDGDCGGYNLHWAWASGYVCADGIINY